ncbi:hypothetical protein ACOI1C_12020 [Bacillus sp. DJP31]|uniref:hypothetical protein n=1 Tax=Bacillus sp. DJP31 TaxID=3409789 RepID=UPI003BB6B15F
MNIRIITIFFISILLVFPAFYGSKSVIDHVNSRYVQKDPLLTKETLEEQLIPQHIDKMISHGVPGTFETTLPVEYVQDFMIHKVWLYVLITMGRHGCKYPMMIIWLCSYQ